MRPPLRPLAIACAFSILTAGCPTEARSDPGPGADAAAAPPKARVLKPWAAEPGRFQAVWKEVSTLMDEQKLEAALTKVEKILAQARAASESQEIVRALIRIVQIRSGLHGLETSVRFLREQSWPEDLLGHAALSLYYARTLVNYARAYPYEINQREKVDTRGAVDLKAWTREQIYEEAIRAYADVWAGREALGDQPVSGLGEYLKPNNYPAGVRPTLRDALTYLFVELLADTNGWRPEHNNEVFRLDLGAHLSGDPKLWPEGPTAAFLSNPTIHPLTKICAALHDLEAFHAAARQPDAALEAAIQRLQQLHARFTDPRDRARVRSALEERLQARQELPWWSAGMAALAEMVRQTDAPDALARAREVAVRGRDAHADSIGGQRCRAIVESIEAPSYELQGMAIDSPGKRSLGITHRNLAAIWLRAFPVDILAYLEKSNDWNLYPSYRDLEKIVGKTEPVRTWKVELPPTPDFRDHRTYTVPPFEKPGFYIVLASAREDFRQADNVLRGLFFQVSDLVVSVRQERDGSEIMVQSGATGAPLAGVELTLYKRDYQHGHKKIAAKRTDAAGVVRFQSAESNAYFLVIRNRDQLTVDPRYLNISPQKSPEKVHNTFLFTDRSVYRPLQKLQWKAVVYAGAGDAWQTSPGAELSVFLRDPNNQEVAQATVKTNEYGTASGEFSIPAGRVLGMWNLVSSRNGAVSVRVEEYKRPTFEVKLLESKVPMRLNKPATVRGEARYYFGLPVSEGRVAWRVARTPVYPWWWSWWGWAGQTSTQVVATGTTALKPDGSFAIDFTPEADLRESDPKRGVTFRYAVSADVTDEGGETRSAERSVRLGFVAVEARLVTEQGFLRADRPSTLKLVRTDLDGAPAPGRGRFRLLAVDGPAEALLPADQPIVAPPDDRPRYQTEGDQKRPRWAPDYNYRTILRSWPDGAGRAEDALTHDAKGEAAVNLPPLKPGAYRLRYETEDAFGAKYEMSQELLVAGPRTPLALPALLLVERSSVGVGETARVWALSGLRGQALVLDIHSDRTLVERRLLASDRDAQLIEIPVTEKLRGGFGVTLSALRDHQAIVQHAKVFVPWDPKELKLTFATFRDKLRPGTRETWTVRVNDKAGRALGKAVELLAYMYDKSLDVFAAHVPPSPLELFPNRSGPVVAQPLLGLAPAAYIRSDGFRSRTKVPSLTADHLVFPDPTGIGGPGRRREKFRTFSLAAKSDEGAAPEEEASYAVVKKEAMPARAPGAPPPPAPQEAQAPTGGQAAEAEAQAPAPAEIRTDFSETAFFLPHLVADADGTARIEFQVPDSVTAWNVWVHGITRDMRSGSLHEETRSVKELMVRPYLPRFLREGDRAVLKVVVNNASERPLRGALSLEILEPEGERSLAQEFGLKPEAIRDRPFTVEPGGGADLAFELTTPARVGPIAIRVVARAGDHSDGELRLLPVLPGRMHLAQSRFVTLKDRARREMTFADMQKADDPSLVHESLVVTLDAQLFYQVLAALPYLIDYPYECTEQTLNRFLSTGIVASVFDKFPAIEKMARAFSARKTQFEAFAEPDPNRRMALEETPWLELAQGGPDPGHELVNVLDSRVARSHRDDALLKLQKAQTSSGGFPWWAGGPPSDWITLYLLYGFSKGLEFGVKVPEDMVQRAWGYLHQHYLDDIVRWMRKEDCCFEEVTFLNYVLSNYPDTSWTGGVFTDEERRLMLAHSFKHWKQHTPYLKGYLALTLKRMGRPADAKLVWASVMDSAKTAEDQGTFWAPEDRGWLWYNDSIETHAFAIRTQMELDPSDPKLDGLVLWILLNKKMNHWKSTRATSEVVYSLVHYLKKTGGLGVREAARVTVGPITKEYVFEPDVFTGKKNQLVVPGPEIDPAKHKTIVVSKETPGHLFASATWNFSTERLPAEDRGDFLQVSRTFFKRVKQGRETTLRPLADGERLVPGDEVEVQISLRAKHPMEYVHLRDPRGAGFEPVSQISRHRWDLGLYWYEEVRDSGQNFFFERLPQGEFTFKYRLRAALAGTYKVAPATLQPMYAPEFNAYSAGQVITIAPAE